jgi:hypothetical protein
MEHQSLFPSKPDEKIEVIFKNMQIYLLNKLSQE